MSNDRVQNCDAYSVYYNTLQRVTSHSFMCFIPFSGNNLTYHLSTDFKLLNAENFPFPLQIFFYYEVNTRLP